MIKLYTLTTYFPILFTALHLGSVLQTSGQNSIQKSSFSPQKNIALEKSSNGNSRNSVREHQRNRQTNESQLPSTYPAGITGRNVLLGSGGMQVQSTTITKWNGTVWDLGLPDPTMNASVEGNYTGPGFSCGDLFVKEGILFQPSGDIEVKTDAICNAVQVSGKLIFNGSVPQKLSGFAKDVTLNNAAGLTLPGNTTINGTLTLLAGTLQTNNRLTLNSTALATARLAKVESGAGIEGNVNVRRHVPGNQASWHFMGVPVANQSTADWSDNFTLTNNFIFAHNEAGSVNVNDQVNGWQSMTGALTPGRGYRTFLNQSFMNSTATFDNNGPLITGTFPVSTTYSVTGYDGGGWNLLANPFACEIDWNTVTRTNVGNQVHFWNQNGYGSYSPLTGIGVNGGSRYISSFQGFFVKATGTGGSVVFKESDKPVIPASTSFLRQSTDDPADVARFTLRGPNGLKDETAIRWMPGTQPFFEPDYDADKLINPEMSFFSVTQEGRKTSIQARNFDVQDVVDLGYQVAQAGSYFLEIRMGSEIFSGKTWELRDNESGFIYPVTANMLFPFEILPGSEASNYRFSLIGQAPAVGIEDKLMKSAFSIVPNPAKGQCVLTFTGEHGRFLISDHLGRKVKEGSLSGKETHINLTDLSSGLYQIQVLDQTGSHCRKLVVE